MKLKRVSKRHMNISDKIIGNNLNNEWYLLRFVG